MAEFEPPAFDDDSPEERLLSEAEELMRQGRFQDAVSRYRDLRHVAPTDLWAGIGHASALECAGKVREAEQVLAEATHHHRANIHLRRFCHLFFQRREDLVQARQCSELLAREGGLEEGPPDQLAELFFNQGRYGEALNELLRLQREHDIDDLQLRGSIAARLGACLRQTGDFDGAREQLLTSLGVEPDNHWTLSELAETERAAGNDESARRYYLQALAANPDDHWCRGHLAQLEHEQGDTDRAIELYEAIIAAEPRAPWAQVELGQVLTYRDPERSRACCEAALSIDAAYPWAWAHLGILARLADDLPTARQHLRTALSHSPGSVWIVHELADTCRQAGRIEEALTHLDHAENLAPFDAGTYGYRADILRAEDRPQEALPNLRKAVELDPDYVWAWREIAELEALAGHIDSAKEAYQEAADIEPGTAVNDGLMAFILRCDGRAEQALPYLERALERMPDYHWAWRELIEYHLSNGDPESALRFAERSLTALPGNVQLLALEAECLRHLGRRDEARQTIDAALEVDDQPAQLWALRAELEHDRDPERALVLVDHAIERLALADFLVLRAQILVQCERLEEADEQLQVVCNEPEAPPTAWAVAAELAERRGAVDRARELIESALAQHPEQPRLILHATRLALEAGEADATRRLDRCFAQPAGLPWRDIAILYARGEDAFGARRAAQLLVAGARQPDRRAEAWMNVAEVELLLGQPAAARQAVDRALAEDPEHSGALLLAGMLAERQGERQVADTHLARLERRLQESSAGRLPAAATLWRQLAQIREHQGRAEAAEAAWSACLAIDGLDADEARQLRHEWARHRLRRDDDAGAAALLDELADATPLASEAGQNQLTDRAQAIYRLQGAGAARELLQASERELGGLPPGLELLQAQLAASIDEVDEADQRATAVVDDATAPGELRQAATRLQIQCALARDDQARASRLARARLAEEPGDEEAATSLAEALATQGELAEALRVLDDEALPQTAAPPRALLRICIATEHQGRSAGLLAAGAAPRLHGLDLPLVRVLRAAWPSWQGPPPQLDDDDLSSLPPFLRLLGIIASDLASAGHGRQALVLLQRAADHLLAQGRSASARQLLRQAAPLARRLGRRRLAWRLAWRAGSLLTLLRCLR